MFDTRSEYQTWQDELRRTRRPLVTWRELAVFAAGMALLVWLALSRG